MIEKFKNRIVIFFALLLKLNVWRDIKTAPKVKGHRFLAKRSDGFVFITEYRPEDVDGDGCYGSVDSCCGYYEDMKPVEWKEI